MGLQSSEGLAEAGWSTSKMATHLMLAVGWRPQLLGMWATPQGCLSVLTTWQLVSPQASDLGENKEEATCLL